MSTASFDKTFAINDPKAIKQLLFDLEHSPKPNFIQHSPKNDEQTSEKKRQVVAMLKNKFVKNV